MALLGITFYNIDYKLIYFLDNALIELDNC